MPTTTFAILAAIGFVVLVCVVLQSHPWVKKRAVFIRVFGFEPPCKLRDDLTRRAYLNPLVQARLFELAKPVAEIAAVKRKEIETMRTFKIPFDPYVENDKFLKKTESLCNEFVDAWSAAGYFGFPTKSQYDYYARFMPENRTDAL